MNPQNLFFQFFKPAANKILGDLKEHLPATIIVHGAYAGMKIIHDKFSEKNNTPNKPSCG